MEMMLMGQSVSQIQKEGSLGQRGCSVTSGLWEALMPSKTAKMPTAGV